METIDAIVGEGGVLHIENVPFEAGKRLKVTLEEGGVPMTEEEWWTHLERARSVLAHVDFDLEDQYPEPIEPLRLSEEPPRS